MSPSVEPDKKLVRIVMGLLALILLLVPSGEAQDPRWILVDNKGDVEVHPDLFLVNVAQPEIDILTIELRSLPGIVEVSWQIDNLSSTTLPIEAGMDIVLAYRDEKSPFSSIEAWYDGEKWTFLWFGRDEGGNLSVRTVDGLVEADNVRIQVPSSWVHGVMQDIKGSTLKTIRNTSGGMQGGGPVWFRDWAPDDGAGPTFRP